MPAVAVAGAVAAVLTAVLTIVLTAVLTAVQTAIFDWLPLSQVSHKLALYRSVSCGTEYRMKLQRVELQDSIPPDVRLGAVTAVVGPAPHLLEDWHHICATTRSTPAPQLGPHRTTTRPTSTSMASPTFMTGLRRAARRA